MGLVIGKIQTTTCNETEVKDIIIKGIEERIPGKVISITITQIPEEKPQETVKIASCLSEELAHSTINLN